MPECVKGKKGIGRGSRLSYTGDFKGVMSASFSKTLKSYKINSIKESFHNGQGLSLFHTT